MSIVTAPRLPIVTEQLLMLSECVCEEVSERGAGPLCSCGFYPGLVPPFDACGGCSNGTCGTAWLRVVTAFPYQTFPVPTLDANCRRDLAWQVEIGAVRCMPTSRDGGPLDQETIAEVWVGQMLDAEAIGRAVACCGLANVALGVYQPIGPEGGCVGGFWTAYLGN